MPRRLIVSVLISALFLTTVAPQPAEARDRNRETAQILAGISALFILGKIIENNNREKKKKQEVVTRRRSEELPPPRPDYRVRPRTRDDYYRPHRSPDARRSYDPSRLKPRPLPAGVARKFLPSYCEVRARTRSGPVYGFHAGCLGRNYAYADRLPQSCLQRARVDQRRTQIYNTHCLLDRGYRIGRR